MSSNTSAGRSNCQNCGAALHGPYCAACGQHDVDYHRSLWPILEDALEGFLHIDGKFFRTVRLLFTRPGFLTQEFNAGRRVAYTQPLRLYIFASLLFFAANVVKTRPPTEAEIARANTEIAQIRNETAGGNAGAASKPEQAIPSAVPSALRRRGKSGRGHWAIADNRSGSYPFGTSAIILLPARQPGEHLITLN